MSERIRLFWEADDAELCTMCSDSDSGVRPRVRSGRTVLCDACIASAADLLYRMHENETRKSPVDHEVTGDDDRLGRIAFEAWIAARAKSDPNATAITWIERPLQVQDEWIAAARAVREASGGANDSPPGLNSF